MSGSTSAQFKNNVKAALVDKQLQKALKGIQTGFVHNRKVAAGRLQEFEDLRDRARDIKTHTISHMDAYLEIYQQNVEASGGHVHWAIDETEAREIILGICRSADAKTVTKGKTMIGEEIAINDYLEENGIAPIETDLGEYIIQLRGEMPSHIIAPASHVSKEQVADAFKETHTELAEDRSLEEPDELLAEARAMLRDKFIAADVGITGANFLIAETGSSVIVTNEGNGDLTQTLPKIHIALASIEKIVPTLEDATSLLRVLARSATGQEMSSYTTFSTGPRQTADLDGPEEYHVVILDNGRTDMLAGDFSEMLSCIRCGACLNHCPVYNSIGGHAYGWVYPGPMGAVLTPGLMGLDEAANLPQASTLCGKCEEVCPVRIPLPTLLRRWRDQVYERDLSDWKTKWGLKYWAMFAKRPGLYHFFADPKMRLVAWWARKQGHIKFIPGLKGWSENRNFPAPQGKTFHQLWREKNR
jgi:L-lactate dehydrogenase complex protein LldF